MSAHGQADVAPRDGCPVAFAAAVAPTPVSWTYRVGLLLVTVAMFLVPLLYVLLIAAAGWLLVWHLTANAWLVTSGGISQWRLLAYATPAVAGATLVFFLIKPILARRAWQDEQLQVVEDDQPALFALIAAICRQVRAPMPARVFVDCQVNASAALRGGALALVRRELDLTIGLPLVTGLTVRQLSGVLAHEFGHFAQGGGMRMTALIRTINGWLFRVVHERDAWDVRLDEWSRGGDVRVAIPLALARGSVWVSRRCLSGVAMIGHGVSCFMLRQMEFDADSYEVKVGGTETFAATSERLRELSAGSHVAHATLSEFLEARTAPRDLPRLVAAWSTQLPAGLREQVHHAAATRTGMFDTHPADADRVAAARALATPGALVGGDEPATVLFRDLDGLLAAVTQRHYEGALGIALDGLRLLTTDEAWRGAEDGERGRTALHELFASRVSVTRPLRIPLAAATSDVTDLAGERRMVCRAIADSPVTDEYYRTFENCQIRHDLACCAALLLRAGVPDLDAAQFSLPAPTLAAAESIERGAIQGQQELRPSLDEFDDLVARRLALEVCRLDGQHALDAAAMVHALNALGEAVTLALEVRRFVMADAWLAEFEPSLDGAARAGAVQSEVRATLARSRDAVRAALMAAPAPLGELRERWQRLADDAGHLSDGDLATRVIDVYWASLSILARMLAEHDPSLGADGDAET